MKRITTLALAVVLLTGCYDDISDLQAYTRKVRMSAVPQPEPMPEIPEFRHIPYTASRLRSPFVAPKPEAIQNNLAQVQDCLAPDPSRRRQPLEKYPLDVLKMRGTLGIDGSLWALVEASDGSLYRVREGNYMGLYHGRIVRVTEQQIELVELIPDGTGCWNERDTTIAMAEPEND